MGYKIASLDELGEGYGFRKIRAALGVTAFGVNALVFPPTTTAPLTTTTSRTSCTSSTAARRPSSSTATSTTSAKAGSCTSSRRRTAGSRTAPTTTSSSSSSAARAATSSATASSSAPEDLAKRQGLSAMNGLMMDTQLTLPIAAAPLGGVLRRQGDRHAAARPELPPLHVRATRRAGRARSRSAAEPRPRARRPRRDALLEPLPAPRGVSRHPVRRLRAAHAEPAPAPERPRATSRTHADDKAVIVDRSLLPLLEQFLDQTKIEHVLVVEDSYEELLAGADPDAWRRPRAGRERGGGDVLHERHDRMPKGVLYSHRSTMLHTLGVAAGNPMGLGISRAATRSCRSCRCSTRTRGATRTSRR